MTRLAFDDYYQFHDGSGEFVEFQASDGEHSFTCRVSREAIADVFGATPVGASWQDLFEPTKERIRAALQSKYDGGSIEPDGSIFLRSPVAP